MTINDWRRLKRVGELRNTGVGSILWSPNYRVMTKQWKPLTDPQWVAISPFFDLKRKRKHDKYYEYTVSRMRLFALDSY